MADIHPDAFVEAVDIEPALQFPLPGRGLRLGRDDATIRIHLSGHIFSPSLVPDVKAPGTRFVRADFRHFDTLARVAFHPDIEEQVIPHTEDPESHVHALVLPGDKGHFILLEDDLRLLLLDLEMNVVRVGTLPAGETEGDDALRRDRIRLRG